MFPRPQGPHYKECTTFAPATIAPVINPNVKRNPNPNPKILTLLLTKNPITTLTLIFIPLERKSTSIVSQIGNTNFFIFITNQ